MLLQNLRDSRRDLDRIPWIVEQRGGLRTQQMLMVVDIRREPVGRGGVLSVAGNTDKGASHYRQPPQTQIVNVGHCPGSPDILIGYGAWV